MPKFKRATHHLLISFSPLLLLAFAACTAPPAPPTLTATRAPSATTTPTGTPAPSATPSPTARPTRRPTVTIAPTLQPSSTLAVAFLNTISSDNAFQVEQLSRILEDVGGIALSPDRRFLATARNDGFLQLWDISNPLSPISSLLLTLPMRFQTGVTSATFHPNGQIIAVGTADNTVIEIDLQTQKSIVHDWGLAVILSVAYSPDGKLLAAGGADGKIKVWETYTNSLLFEVQAHGLWVSSLEFSPDENILASGSSSDGLIKIWDMKSSIPLLIFEGGDIFIYDITFSPTGDQVLSGGCKLQNSNDVCDGGILTLWSIRENLPPFMLEGEGLSTIFSVAFSTDGSFFASGTDDGRIWLWNTASKEILTVLGGHTARVVHLQFSADGALLASVGIDNAFRLWGLKVP